ncbi:MAG: ATP-dependent Clp protease adaptor ClpS [Phycisphaerales bacterium]
MTSILRDTRPKAETRSSTDTPVPWNVILLDDDHHTYDYVIEMMRKVFRLSPIDALRIATTVDLHKRAICLTTHKEHAELKRDQILAYGKDHRIAACAGSMSAIIEPAHDPDEDTNKA